MTLSISVYDQIYELRCFLSAISFGYLIALNNLFPPGAHFTAESTEIMRIKCLAQGLTMLMQLSISISRNRHLNHMTNMHVLFA